MNEIFSICVAILEWIAALLGISYQAANIWIFVIIEPIVFVIMLIIILKQRSIIKILSNNKN